MITPSSHHRHSVDNSKTINWKVLKYDRNGITRNLLQWQHYQTLIECLLSTKHCAKGLNDLSPHKNLMKKSMFAWKFCSQGKWSQDPKTKRSKARIPAQRAWNQNGTLIDCFCCSDSSKCLLNDSCLNLTHIRKFSPQPSQEVGTIIKPS